MERFMQLAIEHLDIRYRCAKCSADLHLTNAICFNEKHLCFEAINDFHILHHQSIRFTNLCGALGSRLSLSCANCKARIGYKAKKQFRIGIESVNVVLGEIPAEDEAKAVGKTKKAEAEQNADIYAQPEQEVESTPAIAFNMAWNQANLWKNH